MSSRFLNLGHADLLRVSRASADASFALVRWAAHDAHDASWTDKCDEAVVAFLREWDQGEVALRLVDALGWESFSRLVRRAMMLATSGVVWTREEHQCWIADLADGQAVGSMDLSVAADALGVLLAWSDEQASRPS